MTVPKQSSFYLDGVGVTEGKASLSIESDASPERVGVEHRECLLHRRLIASTCSGDRQLKKESGDGAGGSVAVDLFPEPGLIPCGVIGGCPEERIARTLSQGTPLKFV